MEPGPLRLTGLGLRALCMRVRCSDRDVARPSLDTLRGDAATAPLLLGTARSDDKQVFVPASRHQRLSGSSVDQEGVNGTRHRNLERGEGLTLARHRASPRHHVSARHAVDQRIVRIGPGGNDLQFPAPVHGDPDRMPQCDEARWRAVYADHDASRGFSGDVT
jgi:hypothetical protein